MSIARRLVNLARAELNALLDRTRDDSDAQARAEIGEHLGDLSDADLSAEIERRHAAREEVERAARGERTPPPRPHPTGKASPGSTGHAAPRPGPGSRPTTGPVATPRDPVRGAYAALEVPHGADFATVRKSYRALMRKYHPDRHAASHDKQKDANKVAQRLIAAYEVLEKHLKR